MFGTSTRYGDKISPPNSLIKRLTAAETRQVRSKLKAAAYGMNGVDWHKLFRHYDRNNCGELDLHEFKRALRGDAKISVSTLPNSQVQHLFNSIDLDSGGTIDVEEFITWVEAEDDEGSNSQVNRTRKKSSGYGRVSPTELSSPSQRRFDLNKGTWLINNDEHSTAEGAEFRTNNNHSDAVVQSSVEKAMFMANDALTKSHNSPFVLKLPSPANRRSRNKKKQTSNGGGSGSSSNISPEVARLLREKDAQDALIESQAEQLRVLKMLVTQQFDALSPGKSSSSSSSSPPSNVVANRSKEEEPSPIMEFTCECHCGANRGTFKYDIRSTVTCWECNCSDCAMRNNLHFIIPNSHFTITKGYNDSTSTEYLWGTKTAKRRFCKICGILPWYVPRSNPDGIGITLGCVNWGSGARPSVVVKKYDGIHWERSHKETNISEHSKVKDERSPSRSSVISSWSEQDVEL
jgi:Ca2+-binding EF-hand superfamily protein